MKRPVEEISIGGYKSIKELRDFKLSNLNIFIGANGVGKSNFISVFRLLNQIVDQNLQVYTAQQGGASRLLYFGNKVTEEIFIELKFGNNGYRCYLSPTSGDNLVFSDEEMWFHNPKYASPYVEDLGGGQKETKLRDISQNSPYMTMADHILNAIKNWKVYHFHDTSPGAKVKQKGDISDNEALRADASNLAAFLYMLRETKKLHYQKIVTTIRLAAPFFNDFILRRDPLNNQKILLEWQEKGSDSYFDSSVFSDGTLRFICLSTLLLQPELPTTILIDEPELGLHPYAINLLASLLKKASTQTQVIVSTQSVPLVNQFEPKDIIVVDRKNGESIFNRLDEKRLDFWLDNYGLGDLWEKNLFGGRPS